MKRGVVLLALGAVLAALATPAQADPIRRWSTELSLHGGFDKLDVDARLDDGLIYGAGAGLNVFPGFSVELTYDRLDTTSTRESHEEADVSFDFTGLRLVGTFLAAEESHVKPYVLAGGGRAEATRDPSSKVPGEDSEATYAEVGFGVRQFLVRSLNLRYEFALRHHRSFGVTHTDAEITIGAAFFLGGKS